MKCLKNLTDLDKVFIQKILDKIANNLDNYNVLMKSLNSDIVRDFKFNINYRIERSVAHFYANVLEEEMNVHFSDVILLNEAGLNMISVLTAAESKNILHIVENNINGSLIRRRIMYPDNLVVFKHFDSRAYVFVEYKVNDSFKYFDLANDLIKYLIYTKNSTEKTFFMYVVFNPDDYITINSSGSVIYQVLQDKVNRFLVNFDANVFLYDVCSEEILDSRPDGIEDRGLVEKLESISKVIEITIKIERLNLTDIDVLESDNYDINPFYKNKEGFGKKVITAKVIKDNYNIIESVYKYIINNRLDLELNEDSTFDMNDIINDKVDDCDGFVESTIRYFNNQIDYHLKKRKEELNGATYNVNYRRANWILALVLEFSNLNNIDLSAFRDDIEALHDELEESISLIRQGYNSFNNKSKLNTLTLSIILYIVKLYELIYDNNDGELEESRNYKTFKKKKELMDALKDAMKVFDNKTRGKSLEWNFDAIGIGKDLLSILLKMV